MQSVCYCAPIFIFFIIQMQSFVWISFVIGSVLTQQVPTYYFRATTICFLESDIFSAEEPSTLLLQSSFSNFLYEIRKTFWKVTPLLMFVQHLDFRKIFDPPHIEV